MNKLSCPQLEDQLTVDAWVNSTSGSPEVMQALISIWVPVDSFDAFEAFDAGRTGGLDATGYFGAVFDGRYVYFVPEQHDSTATHAVVLRFDTHAEFTDPRSYAAYDASRTAELDVRGFYGAAYDGTYVYFMPRQVDRSYYHSRLLRLDTRKEFCSKDAWDAFDIGLAQSTQGAGFDGRYLYLVPGYTGSPAKEEDYCAHVIRYDTHACFNDESSYARVDVSRWLGPDVGCYDGASFDGRFIYFAPLSTRVAIRYDTQGEFGDAGRWQRHSMPLGATSFVGAVFDGRFIYYCPYASDAVVRFDTSVNFEEPNGWELFHVNGINGLNTAGFDGGFFDGRFVYFVPFVVGSKATGYTFHSNFLRYDTLGDFQNSCSWRAHDASRVSGLPSVGYNAGAFDGRYFYCAPWRHGTWDGTSWKTMPGRLGVHGVVLRYDTLVNNGSFSLRYCDCGHNGGLNAAVLGPRFLVNTTCGVHSVAGHASLPPGRHRLTGIYDGRRIQLWIDGELVAERAACGRILRNELPVTLGCLQEGVAVFRGSIEAAEILPVVRQPNISL